MQLQNQTLINARLFIAAIGTILVGYTLMAIIPSEFVRITISPITIIIGFVLVVLSIIKPSKK